MELKLELSGYVGRVRNLAEEQRSIQDGKRKCPNRSGGRVERLEAEFHSESFRNRELAEDREVQILVPVRAQRISAEVSERIRSRICECCNVNPLGRGLVTRIFAAGQIGSLVTISVAIVVVARMCDVLPGSYIEGRSRIERKHAIQ